MPFGLFDACDAKSPAFVLYVYFLVLRLWLMLTIYTFKFLLVHKNILQILDAMYAHRTSRSFFGTSRILEPEPELLGTRIVGFFCF